MNESLCYFCQSTIQSCECEEYNGDIFSVLAGYTSPDPDDETSPGYPCYRVQLEKMVSCDISEAEFFRFTSMKTEEQKRRLIPVGCYQPPVMAHEVRFLRRKWCDDPTAQIFLTVRSAEKHLEWLKSRYSYDHEAMDNPGFYVSFRVTCGFIRPGGEIAAMIDYMKRPAADICHLRTVESEVYNA